jgi:hypothetical protein
MEQIKGGCRLGQSLKLFGTDSSEVNEDGHPCAGFSDYRFNSTHDDAKNNHANSN